NDDDSEEDIHFLEELLSDNSIPLTEDKSSDSDHQDDPLFPRPPPKPPDAEFDFKPDAGEEILVVMNIIDEFECLDPRDEFDDDDCFSFMFVIRIFLPYLICSKMFLSFLFAESEDTIFDPAKRKERNILEQIRYGRKIWMTNMKEKQSSSNSSLGSRHSNSSIICITTKISSPTSGLKSNSASGGSGGGRGNDGSSW
nr:hypothetical protein [Tanacetum cinerariifolium]